MKNWVAKDLRTAKYAQRVVRDRTKYTRKVKWQGKVDTNR